MKILLTIIVCSLLIGCSNTAVIPVKRSFPTAPPSLIEECPDLQLIPEKTEKLSEVLTSVVSNYGYYHVCKIKVDSWITWYNEQKQNFESVK